MRHILIYEQSEDGSPAYTPYLTTNSPIVINILRTILPDAYGKVLDRMSEKFDFLAIDNNRFKHLLEHLHMFPDIRIGGRSYEEFVNDWGSIHEYLKQASEEET